MNKLTCVLCGSTDLVKQDSNFICQSCGTQYTLAEAKKMILGDSTPTQNVSNTNELENLYQLARRAKETGNSEHAEKYYNQIVEKDPTDWEANFYSVYYQSMNCKIAGIENAASNLENIERQILNLIKKIEDKTERDNALMEVTQSLVSMSKILFSSAKNHHLGIDVNIRNQYVQEYAKRGWAACRMLYVFGDTIELLFGKSYGKLISLCWETAIKQHSSLIADVNDSNFYTKNKEFVDKYFTRNNSYNPSFVKPEIKEPSSAGPVLAVLGIFAFIIFIMCICFI